MSKNFEFRIPGRQKRFTGVDPAGHRVYVTASQKDIMSGEVMARCGDCDAYVTARWTLQSNFQEILASSIPVAPPRTYVGYVSTVALVAEDEISLREPLRQHFLQEREKFKRTKLEAARG